MAGSNCIDGNVNTICHNSGGYGWLQVDLGAVYNIGAIEVYNRKPTCVDCSTRIYGAKIELWTGSGQSGDKVWSSTLDSGVEDFPFTFNL